MENLSNESLQKYFNSLYSEISKFTAVSKLQINDFTPEQTFIKNCHKIRMICLLNVQLLQSGKINLEFDKGV